MTEPLPYCDDCGRKLGLPVDDIRGVRVAGFYGRCDHCGVIRTCYGIDPEPQKPRQPMIPPAVQEWIQERNGT